MPVPREPDASDGDDKTDAILERILRDLGRGVDPDPAVLRTIFPRHDDTIVRLCAAAADYKEIAHADTSSTMAAPVHLARGEVLGDYIVEEPIAQGGVGIVYRARQRSLGQRLVALKVVPDTGGDERNRTRFQREALLAASLHHPHLAEVYGFGAFGGVMYYAMQLVEGPSLREVLENSACVPAKKRSRASCRRIVKRIAEVASALGAMHAKGLVHRDVKPGNIVLKGRRGHELVPDEPAVLVDFGLARATHADALTRTSGTSATPAYAAPEQLLGLEADARADVFSLGATLHDLLCARRPQDRMQASAGLEPIAKLAPDIDRDLAAIVAKAVDPVAQWRYADARAMNSDLVAWLEGSPVAARRLGVAERTVRWVRSAAFRAAVAIASVIGGLIAATYLAVCLFRVESAFKEGDPRTLLESADALPSLLRAQPFLQGEELVQLAHRETGGNAQDAQREFFARLDSKDMEGALFAASVLVARDRATRDSFPMRFLVRSATSEAGVVPRGEKSLALTFLAELYYDHPDDELSAEWMRCSAVREALHDTWKTSLDSDDRLRVLSALSGCGDAASAAMIAEWLGKQREISEFDRLGYFALERILRRSIPRGFAREIEFKRLHTVLGSRIATALNLQGEQASEFPGLAPAAQRLVISLLCAEREACLPVDLQWLSEGLAEDTARGRWDQDYRMGVICAAGDPKIYSLLLRGPGTSEMDKEWGLCCGLFGRACLPGHSGFGRSWWDAHGPDFNAGFAQGTQQRSGRRLDESAPPASLQTTTFDESALQDLAAKPGRTDMVAEWRFTEYQPQVAGTASGVKVVASGMFSYEPMCFLSLARPGVSRAVLEYRLDGPSPSRVSPPGSRGVLALVLIAQKATHNYLPDEGEVAIDVLIDGSLGWTMTAFSREPRVSMVALPRDSVLEGDHSIEIRLNRAATTPLRILSVSIEPEPEDPLDPDVIEWRRRVPRHH